MQGGGANHKRRGGGSGSGGGSDGHLLSASPTQLRQQSYVEPRPGAYHHAGPGAAAERAPSPAPLPSGGAGGENSSAPAAREAPANPSEVLLEAEPVLSILVHATPVPPANEEEAPAPPPPPTDREAPNPPSTEAPKPPAEAHARRRRAGLVAILAIALATIIGAVVGSTVARSTSSSSGTSPSAAPSPRPATNADGYDNPPSSSSAGGGGGACDAEISAFFACVTAAQRNETACVSCLSDYVPDNVTTCAESESYACTAMAECPSCGSSCETDYVAIGNCKNRGLCPTYTCGDVAGPFSHGHRQAKPVLTTLLLAAIFVSSIVSRA
jgi:hypothetical protein